MKQQYREEDVLRLAKRYQNKKRTYLLVDPLQAKHIPVSPTTALDMMRTLGKQLYAADPDARLLIGFAETATAIGAAAASVFPADRVYLHTTREAAAAGEHWLEFLEEHSHAAEQKLCADALAACQGDAPIILIDDEISTGKTIRNMVTQMRQAFPALAHTPFVAASIINRVSPEDTAKLAADHITCVSLVKLADADYDARVADWTVQAPTPATPADLPFETLQQPFGDPRQGMKIGDYLIRCTFFADAIAGKLEQALSGKQRVLVLGTEECMYPALRLGMQLEQQGICEQVFCHATTRSPIGICQADGYPIYEGYEIHSFYEDGRTTYLYDPAAYDAVIVVTDSKADITAAMQDIMGIFSAKGSPKFYCIRG